MLPAGELDRRIQLLRPSHTVNAAGEAITAWAPPTIGNVWAKVRTLSGREMVRNNIVDAELTYLIRIRYRTDVTPDWRIRYGTRTLGISKVLDVGDRREELEIAAYQIVVSEAAEDAS